MLNFVEEARSVAVGQTEASRTFGHRHRMFQRAEKERVVVDICKDKTEEGRPGKFRTCQELQGGGVLVPAAVLLGLALAGRLVEERYGVEKPDRG